MELSSWSEAWTVWEPRDPGSAGQSFFFFINNALHVTELVYYFYYRLPSIGATLNSVFGSHSWVNWRTM